MIINAKDLLLNQITPGLPNVSNTLEGWFQTLVIGILVKTIVDNRVYEETTNFEIRGVIQPLSPEQLEIKPEGERSWVWKMLHCQPSLPVKTDDLVTIKGIRYRVNSLTGYDEYGYAMYELVQDYQTVIPETAS